MGRGKPLKREKGRRPEQRRFLLYCEGERTEDQYFRGLRGELRGLPVLICLGGTHGEPKSLVRAAIAHKQRASTSAVDRHTAYDEVWCVLDVEAPVPHSSLDEALGLAERHGIGVVLTNPCFELWILLHFTAMTAYSTSAVMQRLLEKHGGAGYSVDRKHLDYAVLSPHLDQARQRARALRDGRSDGRTANPWTDVDVLVERLRQARHG
ncbi:RloB family protein [Streptomyces sp. NPDC020965]|uniref:RloB family protein n=1 Tax=Streptomyces sp. NPDC020965 TaxID=3365105 RepID=UPI0037AA26AB